MIRSCLLGLAVIGLSFCAGLLVFYVPERKYISVNEVWLPNTANEGRDDILSSPVKSRAYEQRGVRFLSEYPSGPEIVEVNTDRGNYRASKCPDFYGIEALSPTACTIAAEVGGTAIYTIARQRSSPNINAYMTRGKILVAVSGFDSKSEAVTYLKSFAKIARRDVNGYLSRNKTKVERVVQTIKREKRTTILQQTEAYKHIPFTPVLPAILPAGWVQQMVRVGGEDPKHPTRVEVYYKKGKDRFVRIIMLPRSSFTLGSACGPTPGADGAYLPCGQVPKEDYYTSGIQGADYAFRYIYRPVEDVVAILQAGAYGDGGQPLLFSTADLKVQESIAKSLRPADKQRLRDATFVGASYDPYPDIKP
ncbi:MAG: hypothetical protein AAB834_03770 [Patescibacteria group bacterium]